MALNRKGFEIIDLSPIETSLLESFEDLPFDQYMGDNRYRRFSQYRLDYTSNDWGFEKLPSRPYVTYTKYNKVAGGVKRIYEPILVDFTPYIKEGVNELGLDTSEGWQINLHQYRVIVNDQLEGVTVPEGIHCDGHDYVMIAVFNRHNITGGEMKLYNDIEGVDCFHEVIVQENQAAILDDRKMFHYVSNIEPIHGKSNGHRDILVIAISKWSDRWYGDEFDKDALNYSAV